jgi:DNA-directed RNA polymerase specialized sigma24 family protein
VHDARSSFSRSRFYIRPTPSPNLTDEEQAQLFLRQLTPVSLELRDLERAIGKLPPEQRQVILLVGLEGMAYEDVATVLETPVGTVRSGLSRGRDQLRRLMGVDSPGPSSGPRSGFASVSTVIQ